MTTKKKGATRKVAKRPPLKMKSKTSVEEQAKGLSCDVTETPSLNIVEMEMLDKLEKLNADFGDLKAILETKDAEIKRLGDSNEQLRESLKRKIEISDGLHEEIKLLRQENTSCRSVIVEHEKTISKYQVIDGKKEYGSPAGSAFYITRDARGQMRHIGFPMEKAKSGFLVCEIVESLNLFEAAVKLVKDPSVSDKASSAIGDENTKNGARPGMLAAMQDRLINILINQTEGK